MIYMFTLSLLRTAYEKRTFSIIGMAALALCAAYLTWQKDWAATLGLVGWWVDGGW